jgi:hypothetical protein
VNQCDIFAGIHVVHSVRSVESNANVGDRVVHVMALLCAWVDRRRLHERNMTYSIAFGSSVLVKPTAMYQLMSFKHISPIEDITIMSSISTLRSSVYALHYRRSDFHTGLYRKPNVTFKVCAIK